MLTNLILGIIITAGALYGLHLMRGMDQFMDEEKMLHKKSRPKEYAVVFGTGKENQIYAGWFLKAGVNPIYLETIYIDRSWKRIKYLAAVSDSDIDNISVCNLFAKMYPGIVLYSLCNESENLKIYKQTQIQVFTRKEELMQCLEALAMKNEVGVA